MDWRFLGSPDGGPEVVLDHERFSYAGKFRMTSTGKVLSEESGAVVAAAAFNRDRTDHATAWIRYVTVRRDRRGEGIGAQLLSVTVEHLRSTVDRVRIAVNNPFAYVAAYKAGFGFTGEHTGLAELVLATDADRSPVAFRAGLDAFRDREGLSAAERGYLDGFDPTAAVPPDPVD